MFSCKKSSELISQSLDRELPFWARMSVRMHVAMCKMCANYMQQLKLLHSSISSIETSTDDNISLSAEAKNRIRKIISKNNP